jgi:hypothetical protein
MVHTLKSSSSTLALIENEESRERTVESSGSIAIPATMPRLDRAIELIEFNDEIEEACESPCEDTEPK